MRRYARFVSVCSLLFSVHRGRNHRISSLRKVACLKVYLKQFVLVAESPIHVLVNSSLEKIRIKLTFTRRLVKGKINSAVGLAQYVSLFNFLGKVNAGQSHYEKDA